MPSLYRWRPLNADRWQANTWLWSMLMLNWLLNQKSQDWSIFRQTSMGLHTNGIYTLCIYIHYRPSGHSNPFCRRFWGFEILDFWSGKTCFSPHGTVSCNTGNHIYKHMHGKWSSLCQALVYPYILASLLSYLILLPTKLEHNLGRHTKTGGDFLVDTCNWVYFHIFSLFQCKI